MNRILFILIFLVMSVFSGCKKLIEIDPPELGLASNNVFASDATAIAAMTSIYAKMSAHNLGNLNINPWFSGTGLFQGLKADEIVPVNSADPRFVPYYRNELNQQYDVTGKSAWSGYYPVIYNANDIIAGVSASTSISASIKDQIIGEAKFMRAFFYFYLVNLYGDVPLVLSTDYTKNVDLGRSSVQDVYSQIINDLKDAKALLNDNYLAADLIGSSNDRIRPNKSAASALLSKVYLYVKDFQNAEIEATSVIDKTEFYDLTGVPLNEVFLKNSRETIFALQPLGENRNPSEGRIYILTANGPNNLRPFFLNNRLVTGFEPGDQRMVDWIGSVTPSTGSTTYYYPYKYKINNITTPTQEYITVLRLAEVYLIRAEARVHNGDLTGAADDINVIRNRAALPDIVAIDEPSMLEVILHERQVELFTEWGNRWFDLKRTGNLDTRMPAILADKGGVWESFKALEPLPFDQLDISPGLTGHQNPGYN